MTVLNFLRLCAEACFLLAQVGRQRLAEIFRRKNLPDFDFRAVVERGTLHPADRLVQRFDLDQPEAGDQITGEIEGPRLTVRSLPGYPTRAPFEVGCRPSPASMTPAFTISSLNLPIAVSNSVLGITPASDSLLAFTITMNRIVTLRLTFTPRAGCEPAPPLNHRSEVRRTGSCGSDMPKQ